MTAEALMRSRYTAYTRMDIDYIARTFAPESRRNFDVNSAKTWAAEAAWQSLQVLSTEKGQVWDDEGVVEFVATYQQRGETIAHHERSVFRKTADDEWRFVEGATQLRKAGGVGPEPLSRRERPLAAAPEGAKVGRNDPCPCGSGKKFKACCRA